ncbi:MAG: NosD domain-containing protein [Thermoplasmatota archaeon]
MEHGRVMFIYTFTVILMLFTLSTTGSGKVPLAVEPTSSLRQNGTIISVTSDQELISWMDSNGMNGNGSRSDPYVIEDLFVDSKGAPYSIYIENTTKHVLIENCTLFNVSAYPNNNNSGYEMALKDASNITFRNNSVNFIKGDGLKWSRFIGNRPCNRTSFGVLLYGTSLEVRSNRQMGGFTAVCEDSTFSGNHLNSYNGMWIGGRNNSVTENKLNGSITGIRLSFARDILVAHNEISNFTDGLLIDGSLNCTVSGNTFNNCGIRIADEYRDLRNMTWMEYDLPRYSSHHIHSNNTINGYPVRYYKDSSNFSVPSRPMPGEILICNCTSVEISNIIIRRSGPGIQIAYSDDIEVKNCILQENGIGISIYNSTGFRMENSTVKGSTEYGLYFDGSRTGPKKVYLNSFLQNQVHVHDRSGIGYYYHELGFGNHWDTSSGRDRNLDGIDDRAFGPDTNLRDWYPLISPPYVPLRAPHKLSFSNLTDRIVVKWEHPRYENWPILNGHRIYRTGPNGTRVNITSSDEIEFVDLNVTQGVNYTYNVTSFNFFEESKPSSSITGSMHRNKSQGTEPEILVHSPGIGIADFDRYHVNISWERPWIETGHRLSGYVLYKAAYQEEMNVRATLEPGMLYFNDTQVRSGHTYRYRIEALLECGQKNSSEIVSVTPVGLPSSPDLEGLSVGDGYVEMSWLPPVDLGGAQWVYYRIFRGTEPDELTMLPLYDFKGLSYNDTPLVNGQTYYYEIFAENRKGRSRNPISFNATPNIELHFAPPRNLTFTTDDEYVCLEWDEPRANDETLLRGYRVYKGTSVTEMKLLTFSISTKVIDRNVTNDRYYHYCVSAVYFKGSSRQTEYITAMPRAAYTPLRPPSNFQLREGSERIILFWNEPECDMKDTILEYHIFRGPSLESFSLLAVLDSYTMNHTDSDCRVGEDHYYFITAVYLGGVSGPSRVLSGSPRPDGNTNEMEPPDAPRNLTLVDAGADGISISWRPPANGAETGVQFYKIYRSLENSDFEPLQKTGSGTMFFRDEGANNRTRFAYYVTALNPAGGSSPSNIVEFIPEEKKDGPEDNVTVEEIEGVPDWVFYMIPLPGFATAIFYILFSYVRERRKGKEHLEE